MTDSGPLVRVELGAGVVLESPPEWPQLPAPTPGESIGAYIERAILGDSFFQELEKRCVRAGLGHRRVGLLRPETHTLEWWETICPDRRFALPWVVASPDEWRTELRKARETVFWRLVVGMFELLRTGRIRAAGRRIDVVQGAPEVEADLWDNPDMALLRSGEFRPDQRWGHPAPSSQLPSYIDLSLSVGPAASDAPATPEPTTAATPPKKKPKPKQDKLKDALLALQQEGENIQSPVSIDKLHKRAEKKAGVTASKRTFERALHCARQPPLTDEPTA
jgi:hypothetical protein